jgi:sugar lactone lactonase YvrE
MTDLDRELAEYGEHWRAAQPPLPEDRLRVAGDRDGSGRSCTRATRRKRRARQRMIGVVAFVLLVASVPVWLAVTRDSPGGLDRAITKDDALVDVRAAIGRTVASGSYESDIETHSTSPVMAPSCAPSVSCAPASGESTFKSSGHIIVNFDPYVMRSDSNNSFGNTRLYVTPTNIWLQGQGVNGAPSGPVGPGTPLSMFAKSIVGALGPSQGGLAAMNLAVPGGQMNLHEEAVASATAAGTGEVRGTPVTYYDVTIDLTRLADTPGLTDVQRDTIAYVLPLLRQGGYSGTTERIGVSDDGYIREITLTNHFTDGSTGTQHHVLSNFGCAPKVNPPDRQPPEAEPRECKAAETPTTTPATTETTKPTPTSTAPAASVPSAGLQRPFGVAAARNGTVFVADAGRHQVLRRTGDGRVSVAAGTGAAGFSGDDGPAVDAQLDSPRALAVAPDGTLFVADTGNDKVRAISPSGVITTVASVEGIRALAFGPDGRLFVADSVGVERVEADGSRTTVLPAGQGRLVVGGVAEAFYPSAVAVEGDGSLVVATESPKYVARFTPSGDLVGAWVDYVAPGGLATGPDGSVYVASYGGFSIERLTPTGPVTVVKFTDRVIDGINGTFRPQGVAVAPDGTIYAVTNGGGTTNDRALISITPDGTVKALLVN